MVPIGENRGCDEMTQTSVDDENPFKEYVPRHSPTMKIGSSNDFQTPPSALLPLIPFINKDLVIWECAEGRGNLSNALRGKGYPVIGSDIFTGHDFLGWEPREHWDCIVTNPPFSLKQQFLERCYFFKKPFALLLPLTTFDGKTRMALFKTFGVQVIFLPKRVVFETPTGRMGKNSSPWFATAWFTWGLNLPKDLIWPDFPVPVFPHWKKSSLMKQESLEGD